MNKKIFIILAVTVLFGGFIAISNVSAHYSRDQVNTEVKNIDNGVQITVTSDDSQIIKEIQANASWYKDSFGYGQHSDSYVDCGCPMNCMGGGKGSGYYHGSHGSCC